MFQIQRIVWVKNDIKKVEDSFIVQGGVGGRIGERRMV